MSSLLIKALQNPDLYPHSITHFKVIETHSAWVITTGTWVYKIKKSVNFGFLDYSSLKKRHFYCEQEVKLNSLLTQGLYDSVVLIYGNELEPSFLGGNQIVEYAIKMREFPQENLFSHLLEQDKLTERMNHELAEVLAHFHQETERADPKSEFGHPEQLHVPTMENFSETMALLQDSVKIQKLRKLSELTNTEYQRLEAVFKQRKEEGFIRQCHGDVYLKNIVLIDNKPVLFDRIEFNEAFIWTDTMADLGFLLMDLEENGAILLARELRNTYMKISGDYKGLLVLPYYSAYRAMVRAKVDQICLAQNSRSADETKKYEKHYETSLRLVENYLSPKKPCLIILYGFTASGKSYMAQTLLTEYDAVQIQADVERKRLVGKTPLVDTTAYLHQGIYTPEHTEKVYQKLLELAGFVLEAGYTAIVDATFLKHAHRELFQKLAENRQVDFYIVPCSASESVLRERLEKRRQEQKEISNSTLDVLEYQLKNYEPLTAEELNKIINRGI